MINTMALRGQEKLHKWSEMISLKATVGFLRFRWNLSDRSLTSFRDAKTRHRIIMWLSQNYSISLSQHILSTSGLKDLKSPMFQLYARTLSTLQGWCVHQLSVAVTKYLNKITGRRKNYVDSWLPKSWWRIVHTHGSNSRQGRMSL